MSPSSSLPGARADAGFAVARLRPAASEEAVAALLRDLGPRLQRGSQNGAAASAERGRRLALGIPALDDLIGGGLPAGRLSELSGPPSSGRTSLALALLACTTRAGEVVGVVDAADAFHPASAHAAGVRLDQVLWARPPGAAEAARCCERLLQAQGFAAVLLDAAGHEAKVATLPAAVWQRLSRAAAATGTAFLVLSQRRVTGPFAELVLELQPTHVRFSGSPRLFEGLEIEATVTRQRRAPPCGPTSVRLDASRAA